MYYIIFLLYSLLLLMFGVYIRFIEISDLLSCFVTKEIDPIYDYIVVGCGSAGSLLALRLAEDKRKTVLVLEAGPTSSRWLDIPAVGPLLQLSTIDWQYRTVPQGNAAKALQDRVSSWPMGRVVGGTGALNNMIYLRGHPSDFKDWYRGFKSFNYKTDILHYFKKTERQIGRFQDDTKYHSTTGPLTVDDLPFTSPLAKAVLGAAEILGYAVRDLNSEHSTGFMQPQLTVKEGARWTPAHHFYYTKKNPNLILQTNSFVHKVLFKGNYEAYAVKFSYLGLNFLVRARKAVILSAGVVGTPKLLMLSGVGPRKHLTQMGIKTKVNLPIGNNLQDHVTTGADLVLLNTSLGIDPFSMISPIAVWDYFYHGKGPWTSSGCETIGILSTNSQTYYHDDLDFKNGSHIELAQFRTSLERTCPFDKDRRPDLGFMVIPIGASTDGGKHLRKAGGINDHTWQEYFSKFVKRTAITILPIVLHPKSRGTVRLASDDPHTHPLINPNYLSHPHDVEVLLKGIEIIKKMIRTEPMQQLGAVLNKLKFPGCEGFRFDTREYWECYVRHLTLTSFHPAGTCRMGNVEDKEAVVGYDFRVYGTNKLYVADASIMPSLPSGNPFAAVLMIAEKVADELKYQDFSSEGVCSKYEIFGPKRNCEGGSDFIRPKSKYAGWANASKTVLTISRKLVSGKNSKTI